MVTIFIQKKVSGRGPKFRVTVNDRTVSKHDTLKGASRLAKALVANQQRKLKSLSASRIKRINIIRRKRRKK